MLNVITVYYNYCQYQSRFQVSKDFIERYQNHPQINLFVVELVYQNQDFVLTNKENQNHLQLRTEHPLWHKENLINIGIQRLLPKDWKYVAWIDCNLEFENNDFIEKTLEKLKNNDFVQMFSLIKYKDKCKNTTEQFYSFVYSVLNNRFDFSSKPGGAWACTYEGYQKIGKLFDKSLCESDCILAHALALKRNYYFREKKDVIYLNHVHQYVQNIVNNNISVSCVNNIVSYFWHGNQDVRKYHLFRKQMIVKYHYNPGYFSYDNSGVLVPSNNCSSQILDYIKAYFNARKEDNIIN
jgi:hypothetical protein